MSNRTSVFTGARYWHGVRHRLGNLGVKGDVAPNPPRLCTNARPQAAPPEQKSESGAKRSERGKWAVLGSNQ